MVPGSSESCVEVPGFRVKHTRFGVGPGEPLGEHATVDLTGDDRSSGPTRACSNGYVQATSNGRAYVDGIQCVHALPISYEWTQ